MSGHLWMVTQSFIGFLGTSLMQTVFKEMNSDNILGKCPLQRVSQMVLRQGCRPDDTHIPTVDTFRRFLSWDMSTFSLNYNHCYSSFLLMCDEVSSQ